MPSPFRISWFHVSSQPRGRAHVRELHLTTPWRAVPRVLCSEVGCSQEMPPERLRELQETAELYGEARVAYHPSVSSGAITTREKWVVFTTDERALRLAVLYLRKIDPQMV